jgi:hypothetical protein
LFGLINGCAIGERGCGYKSDATRRNECFDLMCHARKDARKQAAIQ